MQHLVVLLTSGERICSGEDLNAFEVTFLGLAWIFVTAGTVVPLQCHLHPTGRIMRELFGGGIVACIEFSVGAIAVGGVMIGGWWVIKRFEKRIRTLL